MPAPSSTDEEDSILSRARRYHYRSLSPDEYEALLRYRTDWADRAADAEHRFFLLGSFAEGDRERLSSIKSFINDTLGSDYVAYTMDDFIDDPDLILNPILKFKLIADDSHHILAVCEHDQGGQLIEHGLIIESRSYIAKTHMLKRRYDGNTEKTKYSWMQAFGTFEIFSYHERLYSWETVGEFDNLYKELVRELIG
jgi:hypothetical protein